MLRKTATGAWVFNETGVNEELKYWNNSLYVDNEEKLKKHHIDNYLFYSALSDKELFNYLYQNMNKLNKIDYSTDISNQNDKAIVSINLSNRMFRLNYFTHETNENMISNKVIKELAETDIHLNLILSILFTRYELVMKYPSIFVNNESDISCVYEQIEFVERADRLPNA